MVSSTEQTPNNLLNAYGVASKVSSEAGTKTTTLRNYNVPLTATAIVDGSTTDYNVTANQYNIASDPLYFVRSGNTDMGLGFLRYAGIAGYYWSRSGVASTNAYNLAFNASGVYPSNGPYARYHGFSLRCLQE